MKACIILLVLVAVMVLEGRRYRSDYQYFPDAGGWLKLQRVPANWREARLRCHLEGGVLASPLNPSMAQALSSLVKSTGSDCIFTGIHATFSRGDFSSVEGTPLARIPLRWAAGEPDNERDGEQCVALLKDGTAADVPCTETFRYACYRKDTPDLQLSSCGTFDDEYQLDRRTGSCYKFHTVSRTWSRAYMTCAAEGGHLAIINSDTEATALRELFARHPPPRIENRSPFGKEIAFIGFQDWGERGVWRTIHGETLHEAGYATWNPGQPDNLTGEFCGGMFRSGKLDDLWCHEEYGFICEMAPNSLLWED